MTRWEVTSKSRYSRAGGWRKEADHYLMPDPEGRQDATGAAVIQGDVFQMSGFVNVLQCQGRRKTRRNDSLVNSAPVAKLSVESPYCS